MFTPKRHAPDDPDLGHILALIRENFAYMEARIDPPSSMHRLTREALAEACETGEVWSLGPPPRACVVLTFKPDALYLGKLATDKTLRGQGLARQLVEIAEHRARALGLPRLELQTRVELVENHRALERLGFVKTGETAHDGYDRPTSITMQRPVTP